MMYHINYDIELRKNPCPGRYIAIEGIDGSGKSTQIERLEQYFLKQGKTVVITSEPNESLPVGKMIRQALKEEIIIPSVAFQYLYTADRVINHETIVEPALQDGTVVLSHRSFWSAVPYGVFDKGEANYDKKGAMGIMLAQGILSMYHQFITPDFVFYLKIPVATAMQRLDKMDKEKEIYERRDKLAQIVKGYDWLANEFPEQFTVIDGTKSVEEITKEIISHVK